MNNIYLRVAALLMHAFLNVVILSTVTNYDITSSWLETAGFIALMMLLIFLFVKHIISFINYIKAPSK